MSASNSRNQNLICSLDIGTTKVAFVIASASSKGIEILGLGQAANAGVRQGVIVNIESTADAIKKARDEAELMSGRRVEKIWLSVGGAHIQSFDSSGMIAVRNREVTIEDVDRVIEAAKAVAIPSDRQVLHVLPKDFKLDGQDGIADPKGMTGVRLEAAVHIITGNRSIIHNTIKCVQRADLQIAGLVLTQLASAKAVLSEDEKNLGVSVVDIGGGTCDIITYQRGSVTHTACIPIGGNNFTHDVALGLRATQLNAEAIKKKYGYALPDLALSDESIEVESVGGNTPRTIAQSSLCKVLEARSEETLKFLLTELQNKGFIGKLGSGVVLTGGAAELRGFVDMAEFVFDMPVRMGVPIRMGGLADVVSGASYSCAVGLLLYGYETNKSEYAEKFSDKFSATFSGGETAEVFSDWGRKIKDFFASSL